MRYWFDRLIYDGEKMQVNGWACPETLGDTLIVELFDMDGNPVDCPIRIYLRTDVLVRFFNTAGSDQYGFKFDFKADKYQDLYLKFSTKEHDFDYTGITLEFKSLYEQYHKDNTFIGKVKRFRHAPNKREFAKGERYRHLYGEEKQYAIWYDEHYPTKKVLKQQKSEQFNERPLISVLVPVYKPKLEHIRAMIESVRAQSYGHFELCLANGSPEDEKLRKLLVRYARKDKRIKVENLSENTGISGNTNAAMKMAAGEWIALLDQDDFLSPDALYEYVKAINEDSSIGCLYSDEDKFEDRSKTHRQPYFKTDYNENLLHCCNYICHFFMVKKSIAEQAGGFRKEFDGAQDYDFILRCTETEGVKTAHIAKILYTWRIHSMSTAGNFGEKNYANDAGAKAIEASYKRRGYHCQAEALEIPGRYKPVVKLKGEPLVSILIPNKDHIDDLKRCVDSLLTKQDYRNIEILIIENNSTEPETFSFYETLKKQDSRIKVLTYKGSFNFAAINNFAEREAKGEYLLLLNNDTEVISEDFLTSMLSYAQDPKTGIVGARLLYEDRTIQHAGVLVLTEGAAHHVYLNASVDEIGYMGRLKTSTNLSAVTAACLLVRRSIYEEVGGMEEAFTVAYNDVDFCLKVCKAGYSVVYDAFAELFHYESKSRGYEDTEEKQERFKKETELLYSRWPKRVENDPYYNKNLTLKNGYYSLP